jgi:sulfate adenylyltransferase subunit 2
VLEAEGIHIVREVAAEFERPVLLFSGGKDSIVMLALAERAFAPARIPFPVMHVDTGHNFREALEFRDRRVTSSASGQSWRPCRTRSMRARSPRRQAGGPAATGCQTTTLLDGIADNRFDAVFGGARRDEEKARAKGGCSRSATSSASGTPRTSARAVERLQHPIRRGEHIRSSRCPTGPSSTSGTTSTEAAADPVDLLRAPADRVRAGGILLADNEFVTRGTMSRAGHQRPLPHRGRRPAPAR